MKSQWNEAIPQREAARTGGVSVIPLLVPFVIAGLLWLWGKPIFAAIVAGIGAVLVLLRFGAPSLHETVLGLLMRLGVWLGRLVSNVILSIVYFVVFVPVAMVARILGRDPLALEQNASSRSYWVDLPEMGPERLFSRPFLRESGRPAADHDSPKAWRVGRRVYHDLVGLFLINLVLGTGYKLWQDYQAWTPTDRRGETSVYRDVDWAADYFKEFRDSYEFVFKPYIGWTRKDYQGQYINIENGLRRTYQPEGGPPATLWLYMFGGSTAWGTGSRDDHTIASYLAKLAHEDGYRLGVRNYGESGFVNWQNVLRLAELCAEGTAPQFAVFYEGANDVYGKLQIPSLERAPQNFDILKHKVEASSNANAYQWLTDHSLIHLIGRDLGLALVAHPLSAPEGDLDGQFTMRIGREVAQTLEENASVISGLHESCGFKSWLFWQPVVYTKAHATSEEREFGLDTGFEELTEKVYLAATAEVRSRQFAVDITDAFDGQSESVYIDWAHTGELGNELVAARIYEVIRPALEKAVMQLSQDGGTVQ